MTNDICRGGTHEHCEGDGCELAALAMTPTQRKCTDESCVLHGLEHEGRPCKRAAWALPGSAARVRAIAPSSALPDDVVVAFQRLEALYDEQTEVCRRFDAAYFPGYAAQMDKLDERIKIANGMLFGALKASMNATGNETIEPTPTQKIFDRDGQEWRLLGSSFEFLDTEDQQDGEEARWVPATIEEWTSRTNSDEWRYWLTFFASLVTADDRSNESARSGR